MEQSPHPTESAFRALFDACLDAVAVISTERIRVFDVNPAACRLFGASRAELLAGNWRDFIDTTDLRFLRAYRELRQTGEFHGEIRMLWVDGSPFPAKLALVPYRDAEGSCRAHVVIRDLTVEQPAAPPAAGLSAVIEKAPIAIVLNRGGTTIAVNTAGLRLFGYADPTEVIGTSVFSRFAPEHHDTIRARLRARERGTLDWDDWDATIRRQDGTLVPVHIEAVGVNLPDGPAIAGFYFNLSERRARARSQQEQDRLEGAIFAARTLADRLNNAFTVVLATLDLLQPLEGIPPELRRYIADSMEAIESSAGDLSRLQRISRVVTCQTPVGPALDLDRSAG